MKKSMLLIMSSFCMAGYVSGAETVPCVFDIPDADALVSPWTVIDGNGDGSPYRWEYANQDAKYTENKYEDANDWIISPSVSLEEGKVYAVKFYVKHGSTYSTDKQIFEMTVGQGVTVADQTTVIRKESAFNTRTYTAVDAVFTPEQSGEYNFGLHLCSDKYKGDFYFRSIEINEKIICPGAVTSLAANAAEDGVMQCSLSWIWPEVNDAGGVLGSVTGANIYRGTSQSFAADENSLVGSCGGGVPGQDASWTDENITEPGQYYYKVIPFDENGMSSVDPMTVKSTWVGIDKPKTPDDVRASVVEGNDKAVSLDFTISQTGEHGGYVDVDALAWKITRTSVSGSTEVLETEWTGDLPYIDETIPGLDSYFYNVYYVYDGATSYISGKSNTVVTGGTVEVPYLEPFASSSAAALYTILTGSEGSRTWGYNNSKKNMYYWGGDKADAWLITPGIRLEAGKAYELSFDTYVTSSKESDIKDLYVTIGGAATIEAQSTSLWMKPIDFAFSKEIKVSLSVAEDGVYYIGFHCYGNTSYNDIFLDNIALKETFFVPAAASDLSVAAAPQGELKATVSWVNPTMTTAGTGLSSISKVEVYRGDDLIHQIADPVPGEQKSFDDTPEASGTYIYKIIAYLDGNAGEEATVQSPWIGEDIPCAVSEVVLAIDGDGRPEITFVAPTAGVNGGYFDAGAVTFSIVRNPDEVMVAENYGETSFIDESELSLASYTYVVYAHYGDFVSEGVESNAIVIGDAVALPYNPDFTNAGTFDIWTFAANAAGKYWTYDTKNKCINADYSDIYAFTPPFKTVKGEHKLEFKATCHSALYPETLSIGLYDTNDPEAVPVADLGKFEVSSVAYPSVVKVNFETPASGIYYIAYHIDEVNWTCSLQQSDISLVGSGVTDIEMTANEIYDASTGMLRFRGMAHVAVYNVAGSQIMNVVSCDSADVSSLPAGLYIATIGLESGETIKIKFVK